MNQAKAEAQTLLQRLPDDCTFEDIHYHLYVLEKVRRGLEAADTQGTLTQQEVEERFKKWTSA
jgi:hypothetical protein